MRKSNRLIKAGLLTAIIGLVSILNIFAFRATQQPPMASAVRGVAFFDCNYNGLKEVGETGFPNMDVILTGRTSLGDTVTQITTTDGAGLYAFTGVDAGTYRVKYAFPGTSVNLIFSPQNIGGDDGVDSDPNAAGYTDPLSIDGITDIGAVDAGVIDSVCPVIYYTNPLIATLLDGDTLTVGCDNIPVMDGTWARGVNNSGGADLPVVFERVLVRNGNCKQDGFVQFFVCTWTAQNLCKHQTQVRLYLKTVDTVPPTLTAPNDTTINLMLGDVVPAVPPSIPNNDNCSGTGSTITYRDYETTDPCGKIITRIWAAEDACGNQTIDTQRITVVLNPLCTGAPATDTIVLAPFTMTGNTKDTCLAAYLGSDRVLKNTWTLSSTNGVSASVIGDSCVTLTRQPGFSGRDTMGGWHCDGVNANCRFFLLVVNILPDDPSCHLVAVDTLIPISVVCGSNGSYCLTGLNDINSFNNTYTIADNGAAYSGSFNSCSKDTTFSYAYYTLPFMGLSGKYRLDYWKLNGSNVTIASFDSLPQLVDTMRVHDPRGNWAINPANYTISGGTTANTYGQIKVTKLSNGAVGTANVATTIANSGIKMAFTGGLHTVIFTKTLTGCTDTLNVNVFCDTILLPVAVNDVATTKKNIGITISALANDTLNGALTKPLSIVANPKNGAASVDGSNIITYTPALDFCGGKDTLGYEICNADGCDTAWVFITINCPPVILYPVAVNDVVSTNKNVGITINAIGNDTLNGALISPLSIVGYSGLGMITVDGSNNIVYTPEPTFCGGNELFGYKICNANGCDTGWVFVTVNCPPALKPDAVNDVATTTKNNGIVINALLNDTTNGVLISPLSIVGYTGGAMVSVDGSNSIIYIPAPNFCGGNDTVGYKICTATGCDTGWVFITINCPPIVYPIAVDDAVSTAKNTSVTISVLSNDVTNGALIGSVKIINYIGGASVSVDGSDNIVYLPASNFCGGNDTVYYSLCNASGCDTGKVVITVNCPAAGLYPIAINDVVSTLKNASITINALSNDTINGGLKQNINIIQNPTKGAASVNGFNYIVYNPQSNFCGGQDSLSYEICNATGCDTAWVYITVNCPALVLPIANNDAVSTLKNAAITITALANDNTNGALISPLSILLNPSKGTASVDGSNRIVYNPQLGFCGGNDTLTYKICNADGCATAKVVVTINCPAPALPIAKDDAVSTLKNAAITITALANDNTNGALISPLSIVTNPSKGTTSVDGSNNIIYTPKADFCGGNDTLTYKICNADGCATATVIVTINCPIIAPVAVDDAISLDKNTFKLFKPTVNDTLNGALFAVNIITSPTNGSIGFISIDSLIYTPFIGFCGTDTITYSVCNQGRLCDTATIIATIICTDTIGNNQRPVAVDDAVSTLKNTPINIAVIANDTVNGALSQPLSISGNPKNGTAVVSGNQITYTPALDFCGGNDTLSYVICNANGCDTGWAFITVNCTGGNNNTNQPIALDDNVSTGRNTPFIFQPTKNDTLKGTLASLNIVSTSKHGTIAFAGIDSLVYYPQAGYCGSDTVVYSICNQRSLCDTATIFINITCDTVPTGNGKLPIAVDDLATTLKNTSVNIAVLTNDTINGGLTRPLSIMGNPSKGTAVVSANDIVYTPQTGFCGGTDTVSYEICNANGCDTGWVFITVNCPVIILKPDAVNDLVTTTKNTQVVVDVLANDTKNGTLTRTTNIIRQPSKGTAIVNFSNKIVYIPQAGFCGGKDTLTYEICNADGCDTALVIIDIQCVGSNPDAVDDVATVNKNVNTTLSVLSNDAVNGTLIKPLSILTAPTNGTATVDANNNIIYKPTSNFCGANDTLTYEICNNNGCDTARLIITVSCPIIVNRPNAVDDFTSTFKNTGINIDALTNDQLNGVLDSISIINAPKHGVASINGLKIKYQSDSTFCGSNDTLSYSICTSNGCDTAQIIVAVDCDVISNTPPDAVDDARSTIQGRSLTMVVLANDLLHGAALDSAKIVQSPRHGSARFDAFGNIFYIPNATFCGGNDTLTYRICTQYGCDIAQVIITVTCDSLFNLLPIATIDNAATTRNIAITIPVLQNDTLNGADTFRIITFGKHGSAIFNNTNSIVYQPDSIFCNGKDTLVYQICNITGCATAKVIINVTCDSIAKLLPIANADTASTAANTPIMIDISKNDTLRGAKLPVIVTEPKKGIVTILGDKQALYIPNTDAFGRDTFTYVICNAFGCDTTTVGIFIMAGDSVKIFNGFSPNGDGMNDRFVIKGIENYPNNQVYIYNRWGVEVYKTKGYTNDNGWDGSWIGTYLPDGTYFIVIVFNDEKKQRKTGYIQIHR